MSAAWSSGEFVRQSHSSERDSWGARNSLVGFIAKDMEQNSLTGRDLGHYSYFASIWLFPMAALSMLCSGTWAVEAQLC